MDHNVSFPDVEKIKSQVKGHVRKNKVAYSFGAGFLFAGFTCFIMRGHSGIPRMPDGLSDFPRSSPITVRPLSFFSSQRNRINIVSVGAREGRGHPGYMLRCQETGDYFMSQSGAAAWVGTSPQNMSSHLKGTFPDIYGLHFERIPSVVSKVAA